MKAFNTIEKRAYWASALARLSDAISVSAIVSGNPWYALATIATGTIGRELSGFYKLQMEPKDSLSMGLTSKEDK